ncbi:AraC family transcriptional regulator [Flavobacterium sp. 90]|uniref:helix-turn-helix domain-containing protein n=1 Tax=unclassified Flavobacterium TaxID=196869 RepID=UPI000EAD10C4|nr:MULTISPECIES: AraC family transcriptional regulator [unclassified Flavobacterium]RKR05543.1 AraC family transcriptional regulator [Flavobacterium sp. 81]TCK56858.1 AraC family transcriptional regulator [Flavobacterium sp. 90]
MLKVNFEKNKYGAELLLDCVELSEISDQSIGMKELHITNFYEIFFFMEGTGSILLEEKHIEINAPCVLFLRPGLPRQWELGAVKKCMVIFFEGAFIETFLKDPLFLHRLYYFLGGTFSSILSLSENEIQMFENLLLAVKKEISNLKNDSHQLLRAYLYQLLILLNRDYTKNYDLRGNLYENLNMLKFKELIKQNIKEKQTVKEYAALLNINRNKLNQLCHEIFAKDASDIIKNELVESCKYDLLTTDKTITEISYDHNFSAPSNFVRFFKAMANVSPAVYRTQYI